ncbi:MAG: hypothetical protein J2P35_12345 [Actinobacteria bacterium]|nr:hypothetical protein [Actinomycetota bacterium]MBO0785769.1 hypothetical protein [Actinomycetota bacterium]
MKVADKLQIKPGQRIAVIAEPAGSQVALPAGCELVADPAEADVVIAFVERSAEAAAAAGPALAAGRQDRLAWVAYPKAGQRGTDLNRDTLAAALSGHGVRPVRQVAIDDVWSALRFRPA